MNMKGEPVGPGETGYLTIQKPWPSMLRTIYGDDERYAREYWKRIPGVYFAGDAAQCDKDGYIWVLGRVDDVIKVAGHRLSSMEIESALVSHPSVAEAAVVARPDEIKGEAIVCFVTLRSGQRPVAELRAALMDHVVDNHRHHRPPRRRSLLRPAAENAQRQNHAPPAARTRAQRRHLRRHHHARRYGRNRAPREKPRARKRNSTSPLHSGNTTSTKSGET